MNVPNFPADETSTSYTLEISPTMAPYLRWFYSIKGAQDETVEQYLVRALNIYGQQYLSSMVSSQVSTATMKALQDQLDADISFINSIK